MTDRVLILGGGFAGIAAAKRLAGRGLQVTLLDQHNYHLFQPLLYQVATGELLGEAICTPLRRILSQGGIAFRLGRVETIDLQQRRVTLADGTALSYDYLLLAMGTVTNFFGNQQLARTALDIKGLGAAERARSTVLLALEQASQVQEPILRKAWLHFVIAGGGAAGVEFCAALLETLQALVPSEYPELAPQEIEVTLVHGGERLLPGFASKLQQHAAQRLRHLGANLRLQTHVQRYDGRQVHCDSGPVLLAKTLIWTAGLTANPVLESLPVPKGYGGRLLVDDYLRLPDHPEVFVLGDLALRPEGYPCPQVAPFAMQSGHYAAEVVLQLVRQRPLPAPFVYRDLGSMSVLGRFDAVCQLGKTNWTGYPAWMMWLLLHIYRIIGARNRLRALLDWSGDYLRRSPAVQLIRARVEEGDACNKEVR
ncbi:MAG: NAD(P)/FAD-dependent oxidoreductase [Acidithiobacillus sp.]|nr:NAD(P)/FAD-dependent oxidoreductase [Acidithiobacillus sp.]